MNNWTGLHLFLQYVHPAKTQISLCIRAIWSKSPQGSVWVANGPKRVQVNSESSLGENEILQEMSSLGSYVYSKTSMVRTSLGPWKLIRDMGTYVVRAIEGLIMALGQEANDDNLGNIFRYSRQQWYVECTH